MYIPPWGGNHGSVTSDSHQPRHTHSHLDTPGVGRTSGRSTHHIFGTHSSCFFSLSLSSSFRKEHAFFSISIYLYTLKNLAFGKVLFFFFFLPKVKSCRCGQIRQRRKQHTAHPEPNRNRSWTVCRDTKIIEKTSSSHIGGSERVRFLLR